MSGSFALKLFYLFFGICEMASAKSPAAVWSTAQVMTQGALVYKSADFDSPILGKLGAGKNYEVYPRLQSGAFYPIRVGKILGYIADSDIRFVRGSGTPPAPADSRPQEAQAPRQKKSKAPTTLKKRKPFALAHFLGLSYFSNYFKEDTMGTKRQEVGTYLGVKITGPDLLVEGEQPTEINFQFHTGAPNYYKSLTGNDTDGFIFLLDLQWLTVSTLNPFVVGWIGFGPFFRYSKFIVALTDPSTSKSTTYSAEDMALGAVFSLGMGFRLGNFALRPELKYYWEKEQYYGGGASLLYEF